ncbi:UDP-N-acetylglucosamine 2-epimerase (non-hydrolyzing) [Lapillicoccus sp.]|uniref:non-hydrolyzing UDP-N-acetylglucosamine 2-epimerase n=1 Tax=Lapillicoccus sp. TaxID=1909287 RepID=UPI0025DC0557|nr:UDP-N-acetylglucosamine 2-epimerase (non-hydrolyzing) [Lapillicoccus sp.]
MLRVMTIYGTRPEAIKMAPLIAALRGHAALEPVVAVTGQHREMLDQVNTLFGIVPDHDLDLMTPGATLAQITSRTMTAVSDLLAETRPDLVVVQGDTSSAFIAALAAFYHQIPVVHLEAGLRTGDIYSPFPEEVNRRLTAPIAALHLAPTSTSRANLEREGIDPTVITVTGNTVIDALQTSVGVPATFVDPRVAELVASGAPVLLVTSHRRESWGARMADAMGAVRDVAERHPEVRVLLPMHRNALVRDVIEPALGGLDNVLLTEPLSYHEFSHVLGAATVVLTDSGGVQEEAPSLGKPVLVMRDTTERPEAVHAGTVKLVGTDRELVRTETLRLFEDDAAYAAMANATNPYGDGHAAPRGVAAIAQLLEVGERLPEFASGD